MKNCKNLLSLALFPILVIIVAVSSCKNNNNNDDDNTPTNLKNYAGKTDWNKAVSFQTANIGNDLYITAFSMVFFDSAQGYIHESDWAASSTSGVVKFNGTSFVLSEDSSSVAGSLIDNQNSLNGTYMFKYKTQSGVKSINGTFTSNKQ